MKIRNKNRSGFTLVEILVAVSIFSLLSVVVAGIYVAFSNNQARATRAQRLLNDSQFALVSIAREIRNNQLLYDFGFDDTSCNEEIKFEGEDIDVESCIFLKRNDGVIIAFAKERGVSQLYYLVKHPDADYWTKTGFVFNDGQEGVVIDGLHFVHEPANDPSIEGNGSNRQPFVMIQFTVSTDDANIYKKVTYNLQTSVSSRIYKR